MDNEIKQATRLLQAQRAVDRDEQPLTWLRNRFSSQAGTEFTAREVNKVLAEVIESDGSVGVVKALLALGADVNFVRRRHSGTWNKLSQRNDPGERSDLLLRATVRCRPETVHALAGRADQANLDSALHHAIVRGNLAVLAALLEHGASPVNLHDDFQEVVYHNQVNLLKVLLSGHHLPCLACRSTGLRIAVENRSQEAIQLLLEHWADINYGDAVALIRAVELSRPDLVALLISGPVQPSARSLDAAIGKLRHMIRERENTLDHEILNLCLSAGATGPETSILITEGLVDAVKRRQTRLLHTLLRHKRPPSQYEAAALIEAIRAEQLDIVAKLLEFKPAPASLTTAISQAVSVGSPHVRYEATRLLITSGAQGPCAAEALVKTVHCLVADLRRGDKMSIERDMRLFYLLLHEGNADVNAARGEALQIAVRAACVEVAEEILAKEPSSDSLGAALTWAMEVRDVSKKERLVEMLVRRQIDEDAAGKALVAVFRVEPENTKLVGLLLNRASVNYNNGEVFIYAIRNFRPETFHLLLSQGIGYKPLFTAVSEALRAARETRKMLFEELLSRLQLDHLNTALKHAVLEDKPDLTLGKMLLDSGAEASHEDGLCVKHAASTLNTDLLRLLSEYLGHDAKVYSQAFSAIINRGRQWIAFEHVELIDILLQRGASGAIAGRALVDLVDHLVCQKSQAELAEALLRRFFAANVDVNHENGKAISMAASRGDPSLLSLLLAHGATSSSATLALTAAIMGHHEESLLAQLIDILAGTHSAPPDFNKSIPGMPPPIFLCLKSYGTSVTVLDSLVRAGCRLEATVPMHVYTDKPRNKNDRVASTELEPATVLMWALLQEPGLISHAVIISLVQYGADISYATPKTRTTPFLLAVKLGMLNTVQLLIDAGVRASAKDALGHSALFYASRAGNTDMVKLLLEGKPVINDGSLHEASRGFHLQPMKLLLEAGHDPNYRSIKHGGRTALGEIALQATPPTDIAMAEEVLDLLSSVDASPLLKVHGKTVIFLALDNKHNEAITRLLLDRVLYRTLNSHENTYEHNKLHYSPTMYVSKGILLGPTSDTLLQLLKAHGCEDRFYATIEESQPPDAVGLPEEVRDYERARRARERQHRHTEEDHTHAIRREREKALARAQLEDAKHHRSIQHREDVSQQQRRHRGLAHQQTIQLQAEKHHNDAHIQLSKANVSSSIRWQRHADAQTMRTQQHETKLSQQQQTHSQRLDQRRAHHAVESAASEQRHAQSLAQMRDVVQARWQARDARDAQAHAARLAARGLEREKEEEMLAAERARHGLRMTELRTQRGNIIGQVNLDELRRWQESEAGAVGGGQGKGGLMMPQQGRVLGQLSA